MATTSGAQLSGESAAGHRHGSVVQLKDDHGRHRSVHLDDMTAADRELAEKFGYNPVFKREFGYLATFSFAVSISGLFATVTTTFIYRELLHMFTISPSRLVLTLR